MIESQTQLLNDIRFLKSDKETSDQKCTQVCALLNEHRAAFDERVAEAVQKETDPLKRKVEEYTDQYDRLVLMSKQQSAKMAEQCRKERQQFLETVEMYKNINTKMSTQEQRDQQLIQRMKVEAEQTQKTLESQKQRIDLLTQEKKYLQLILQDFYSDQ